MAGARALRPWTGALAGGARSPGSHRRGSGSRGGVGAGSGGGRRSEGRTGWPGSPGRRPRALQGPLRRGSEGALRPWRPGLAPGAPGGLEIRGHAPRPPLPLPRAGAARWRQTAAGRLGYSALCPGRVRPESGGMGRAAAGSPGHRRQRCRLPGRRRRRRRVLRRRKAPACGRQRARPRRKRAPRSPGRAGRAELAARENDCCVACPDPDPVRARLPCPLRRLAGSQILSGHVRPAGHGRAPLRSSRDLCRAPGHGYAYDPSLRDPTLGEWAGWQRTLGARLVRAAQRTLALQCAARDDWRSAHSMHEFSAKDIDGHMVNLDKYRWVFACLVGRRWTIGSPEFPDCPIPPPGASCASSPTWPRNEAKQT